MCSANFSALFAPHEGHTPRRLQENAIRSECLHPSQYTLARRERGCRSLGIRRGSSTPHPVSTHTDAGTVPPTGIVGHLESGRRSGRGERLRGSVSCSAGVYPLPFPTCSAFSIQAGSGRGGYELCRIGAVVPRGVQLRLQGQGMLPAVTHKGYLGSSSSITLEFYRHLSATPATYKNCCSHHSPAR